MLVGQGAVLRTAQEHVLAYPRAADAEIVRGHAAGAVKAAYIGRSRPLVREEARPLDVEPAQVGALQQRGTRIEMRVGQPAVHLVAVVVGHPG